MSFHPLFVPSSLLNSLPLRRMKVRGNSKKGQPEMTWTKFILGLILMASICTAIMVFGPMFSRWYFRKYKEEVDQNGVPGMAAIVGKNSHKGNSVNFRYRFKNKAYTNREANEHCYEKMEIGDSVEIMLDSLHPRNSYILPRY